MVQRSDVPGADPADPDGSASAGRPQFGLTTAMALVVGSVIGVGIFNLPTSLSAHGPITLVSLALTTVGALSVAVLFAALSRRPPAGGGPYAYARVAVGNKLGFANAWSYWITAWAGNAPIAAGKVRNPDRNIPRATALGTIASSEEKRGAPAARGSESMSCLGSHLIRGGHTGEQGPVAVGAVDFLRIDV